MRVHSDDLFVRSCAPCDILRIPVAGQIEAERDQIGSMIDNLGDDGWVILDDNARTIYVKGTLRPLCCFGVWPLWEGVGRAWAMLSPEMLRNYPLTLHREVKRQLEDIESRCGFRRIEAVVRFGHAAGHRWIKRLGFHREGLMLNYGLGGTVHFYLYARTSTGSCPPSPASLH